jgi:hypothetical protein
MNTGTFLGTGYSGSVTFNNDTKCFEYEIVIDGKVKKLTTDKAMTSKIDMEVAYYNQTGKSLFN